MLLISWNKVILLVTVFIVLSSIMVVSANDDNNVTVTDLEPVQITPYYTEVPPTPTAKPALLPSPAGLVDISQEVSIPACSDTCAADDISPTPVPDDKAEQHDDNSILYMTNQLRKQNGLEALNSSSSLDKAAAIRAEELSVLFSHTRPDGTDCFTVSDDVYGENIAYGMNVSVSTIMDGWLSSSGHRANMLDPDFGSLGVGLYSKDGNDYYVQLFGK